MPRPRRRPAAKLRAEPSLAGSRPTRLTGFALHRGSRAANRNRSLNLAIVLYEPMPEHVVPSRPAPQRTADPVAAGRSGYDSDLLRRPRRNRYPLSSARRISRLVRPVYPLPVLRGGGRTSPPPPQWTDCTWRTITCACSVLPKWAAACTPSVDKATGLDLFNTYLPNSVIKPALGGLARSVGGPAASISLAAAPSPRDVPPIDWHIEHERNGAVTVCCSDHDPSRGCVRATAYGCGRTRASWSCAPADATARKLTQTFCVGQCRRGRADDYQSFFPTRCARRRPTKAKRALTGASRTRTRVQRHPTTRRGPTLAARGRTASTGTEHPVPTRTCAIGFRR